MSSLRRINFNGAIAVTTQEKEKRDSLFLSPMSMNIGEIGQN
jgi:hypothetical protein